VAPWSVLADAQQAQMPVVGYITATASDEGEPRAAAFRRGLQESGYVVGQNVAIEYRWAEQQIDRLPALAADLVQRHVTVIAAATTPAVLAAQAATTTIPIVFETGSDPVRLGLVASLNQPGGNVTGVTSLIVEVAPKRLELLQELLPTANIMALLNNPADRALAQAQAREVLSAARNRKLELHVLNASSGSLFVRNLKKLAALTVRHAVPAIYLYRDFPVAGGLMSYGSDILDTYRLAGVQVARVLKGENPGELPVVQPTKFELVINLKTAKMIGVAVPPALIARADEVIE